MITSKKLKLPIWGMQYDREIPAKEYDSAIIPGSLAQSPVRLAQTDSWVKTNFDAFRAKGCKLLGGCKVFPADWRECADEPGSPPREEYWPYVADLVIEKAGELGLDLVEIGNEPDIPKELVDFDAQWFYGGWTDHEGDQYAGGQKWGRMMRVVYPRIKKARPNMLVIGPGVAGTELSLEFMKGMLSVRGSLYCDAFSFHRYIAGPALYPSAFDYADRIRGMTSKPLICTETGTKYGSYNEGYWAYILGRLPYSNVESMEAYSYNSAWFNTDLRGTTALEMIRKYFNA